MTVFVMYFVIGVCFIPTGVYLYQMSQGVLLNLNQSSLIPSGLRTRVVLRWRRVRQCLWYHQFQSGQTVSGRFLPLELLFSHCCLSRSPSPLTSPSAGLSTCTISSPTTTRTTTSTRPAMRPCSSAAPRMIVRT